MLWVVPGWRDLLHEADQASLIVGAFQLANGTGPMFGPDFYSYDKLVFSYWLLAAVFRSLGSLVETWGPVMIANAVSSLALAGAAGLAIVRAPLKWGRVGQVLTVLLAPAFLLHGPFFSAASLSVAALLLTFTVLERRRRSWLASGGAVVAVFAAVGMRADAVLALPFLVWLTLWPQGRPLRLLSRPLFLAMMAASIAALGVGRVFAGQASTTIYTLVFAPKIMAAYAVFGLGGAMLLGLGITGILAHRALGAVDGWRRFSAVSGVVAFLLPVAFYLPQLFSTRYWFLGLASTLLFVLSRRGSGLLSLAPARATRVVTCTALVLAVAPLFIGVRMPFPNRPRLTLGEPARFPTADGLVPMGNYLGATFGQDSRGELRLADHSQAIWRASAEVVFEPDESGRVPLLGTSMDEILRLRAALQGRLVRNIGAEEMPRSCYADFRSLVKFSGGLDLGGRLVDATGDFLPMVAVTEISKRHDGIAIVRLEPAGKTVDRSADAWRIFRVVFAGSDFRLRPRAEVEGETGELALPWSEGRTISIAAAGPFSIAVRARDGRETLFSSNEFSASATMHLMTLDGRQSDVIAARFLAPPPPNASFATAVLPDYMSARAFRP